jgi:hypothetical protein
VFGDGALDLAERQSTSDLPQFSRHAFRGETRSTGEWISLTQYCNHLDEHLLALFEFLIRLVFEITFHVCVCVSTESALRAGSTDDKSMDSGVGHPTARPEESQSHTHQTQRGLSH